MFTVREQVHTCHIPHDDRWLLHTILSVLLLKASDKSNILPAPDGDIHRADSRPFELDIGDFNALVHESQIHLAPSVTISPNSAACCCRRSLLEILLHGYKNIDSKMAQTILVQCEALEKGAIMWSMRCDQDSAVLSWRTLPSSRGPVIGCRTFD